MSKKYTEAPAITPSQVIRLLVKDGWVKGDKTKHGIALTKKVGNRHLATIVKETNESLPSTTLGLILGIKQSKLGKAGLVKLLNKYGLP